MAWKWSKVDPFELTHYVSAEARKELSLRININDMLQQEGGRSEIIKIIYDSLLEKEVQYALNMYDPSKAVQHVRTSSEILRYYQEGTCLDLAILFCGLCLGCELLPLLVVFEGHALVAVSLNYGLRDWNAYKRKEYEKLFKNVMLTDVDEIRKLVKSGEYLAIECTGFAQCSSFPEMTPEAGGRRANGTLSFERAVEAGKEQFDVAHSRQFRFALDIAVAHNFWGMEPITEMPQLVGAPSTYVMNTELSKRQPPSNLLPYLLDRSEQENDLRKAILYQRATMPLRPLVCIIHGDEYECHTEFLKRIRDVSLPTILEYWNPDKIKQTPITSYPMQLSLKKLTATNYEDVLWEALSAAISHNKILSKEEVVSIITGQKLAVMISVSLFTEDWDDVDFRNLERFFEFWNRWRNLSEDLLLIIGLCCRYRRNRRTARKSIFRMLKPRNLNDEILAYINNLDFSVYENIHGVVLSELQAIRQVDAEALIENKLVSHYYDFEDSDIRKLYRNSELCVFEGCISMETLLENLFAIHRQKQTATR